MTDRKLTASTAITGASVDYDSDQLMLVDVSDTTDSASGTNKKISPQELLTGNTQTLIPMVDPQFTVASAGESYTDVAGDTYAELPSQVRLTMDSTVAQMSIFAGSGHVSAGTGYFQVYNHTDGVELAARSTTSTTEVALTPVANTNASGINLGDEITLRVKNTSAGESVTLDFGGILLAGTYRIYSAPNTSYSSSLSGSINVPSSGTGPYSSYIKNIKVLPFAYSSGTTYTAQIKTGTRSVMGQTLTANLGGSITESDNNTVITRNPSHKTGSASSLGIEVSAASGHVLLALNTDLVADKL